MNRYNNMPVHRMKVTQNQKNNRTKILMLRIAELKIKEYGLSITPEEYVKKAMK